MSRWAWFETKRHPLPEYVLSIHWNFIHFLSSSRFPAQFNTRTNVHELVLFWRNCKNLFIFHHFSIENHSSYIIHQASFIIHRFNRIARPVFHSFRSNSNNIYRKHLLQTHVFKLSLCSAEKKKTYLPSSVSFISIFIVCVYISNFTHR